MELNHGGVSLLSDQERPRSRALDNWDYRVPFARFHMQWSDGDIAPAFEQEQALAIAVQDLHLKEIMDVWGHRAVLVTFSSGYIQVGHGPAEREPAWVVMVAGQKRAAANVPRDYLKGISTGGSAIVQVLIHARTGEVLLGTALPVDLQRRD